MHRNGSRRRTLRLLIAAALAIVIASAGAAAPTAKAAARPGSGRLGGPSRAPTLIDNTGRMDVNDLDMFVTNHGSFAYDLTTGNAGLIYPKGSTNTVVFAGGLWIGGMVNGQLRTAVAEYAQEYVPGPMKNGTFQFDQPAFKNYRIDRGGSGFADYLANAVPQGAPVDGQGNPLLLGDATIWSVFNDADPGMHTAQPGQTAPLGVEVQQSVFAFDRAAPLGSVIFLKWKLVNKGGNTIQNAYVSVWSDPDLGGFADDLAGCDTTLALGYCYNATNADAQYGSTPPAVGLTLLRGPVTSPSPGVTDTLGLTAFTKYINGTDPSSAVESYNYMRGLHADGSPIHVFEDTLSPITTFMVSGDPVAGTGWLDTNSADRRIQLSAGPFTMAPGDSQEVVAAVLVGQGADRLSSITELRSVAAAARSAPIGPPPVATIDAPATESVDEGQALGFLVTSADPNGVATLTAAGLPLGATFSDLGDGTGAFQWTPGFDQAGAYAVTFTAHGTDGSSASATTAISVRDVNRKPVADAGGPYTAFAGTAVSFDGTGSADPDGNPLTYAWDFGDEETGTGPTPSHTYPFHGLYGVALTVSDGRLSDIATTTADIVDRLAARAFTTGGNRTIHLGSGKPEWCVQVEPVGRSFDIAMVDPASIVMKSSGTSVVDQIHAIVGKTTTVADKDGNGVDEMTVCFTKDDLRLLFSDVQGNRTVSVTIEGTVVTGGEFRAALDVGVLTSGGQLAVSLDPNPLSAGGTLRFVTRTPGRVRVTLFDVAGRLVRTVWESGGAAAGLQRVRIDARDGAGRALGSGIYFYRIETLDGTAAGRVIILR
ncbi:MAG TPA: PKD domain-containing protein [Candidatus Eisenbacteria bacterium]